MTQQDAGLIEESAVILSPQNSLNLSQKMYDMKNEYRSQSYIESDEDDEDEKPEIGDSASVTFDFDIQKKAWFPRLDERILQAQQSIYRIDGVDESHKKPKPEPVKKHTAVYVTGLPSDITMDDMIDNFKKGGVFLLDSLTGEPKIKVYRNDKGELKGDALVIYLREESVNLACELLDETFINGVKISVQPAVFQERKKEQPIVDKKSVKHNEQPDLIIDLKQDVRDECENFGQVTNVILFDLEPEGVILVRYKSDASALACVERMNGRFFAGRKIEAYLSKGNDNFKKSKTNSEDDEKRQEDYGKWLEEQDD
ncbi:hypothetical protein HDV01_006225 [Terramyces sp. JEL0728]|nr:hypothetical protein HDV01_006225 [Terramyces sp. JEL0728]